MKKIFVLLLLIIISASFALTGCNRKEDGYDAYFNNFASNKGIARVTESLILDKDIYVSSYDQKADLYITSKKVKVSDSKSIEVFGFATENSVIIEPEYYIKVLDVRYNYAIVVAQRAVNTTVYNTIGVVCIRGEKVGKEYGFSYEYNSSVSQYTFLDDQYLIMFGDKKYKGDTFEYATVYDYTSANGLLEVGRLTNTTVATIFSLYDNYIVAVGKSVVRYYFFDKIDKDGYFVISEKGTYTPFREEDGFEDLSLVTTSVYYIGNGWFVETGMYTSSKQFTGYEQTKSGANNATYYYVNRSTRYNIKAGKRYATDRVTLVANKYSSNYIKSMVNSLNYEVTLSNYDNLPNYFQPILPVSEFIKDGYSLVYYDFDYYDYKDELDWGQSFSVYDSNADIINLKEIIMPLLFVDGIGLQNSDPVYNIVARDFGYNRMDGSFVALKIMQSLRTYDPVVVNDGMIIGYQADFSIDPTNPTSMMGAVSADGKYEVSFDFADLTMFVDGYATGSKIVVTETKTYRDFYRISKSGVITKIENVYCLYNGVYVTKEDTKYGLFANDGKRLLDADYTGISVIENYLVDGVYFVSKVVGSRDNRGVIFKVENK